MRHLSEPGNLLQRLLPYRPFTRWIGELRDGAVLRADLIAGVTVALVLIPQSMAYAQLAGLHASYGLYAAFLPPAVAALLGSSRHLSTGPVAVVSLISSAAVSSLASPGSTDFVTYSILLALMTGMLMIGLGALRMGVLLNLLSGPVIVGFTNAAALIIATSQLHQVLGVSIERKVYYYQTLWCLMEAAIGGVTWPAVGMAALGGALLLGLRNWRSGRLPYVFIAVVTTTALSWLVGYPGEIVGAISQGIPSYRTPSLDLWVVPHLATGAITLTLIGFMEAMVIAKSIATKTRQQIDINQELVGQGMANLVGSFFQSYTVAGSFSRSAVNFTSGARTGFASVVTSFVVMVTLFWLTPLLYHLPQATLAVVIIVAVINLIKVEPIVTAWRVDPQDGIAGVITLVCTLALAPDLHYGILVGVALSLATYLYRTMRPRVVCITPGSDGSLTGTEVHELGPHQKIAIVRFDGRLYFGDSSYFEDKVLEIVSRSTELRYLIVDAGGINQIDATGEQILRDLVERLRDIGVDVHFARAKKQLTDVLERTGCMDYIGRDHFFSRNQQALEYLSRQLNP